MINFLFVRVIVERQFKINIGKIKNKDVNIMDEVECEDCLARTINFTTGSVLLKWMKLNDEKLENYVLRYFFYKKFIGSAIRVTEHFF